jgi:hypothetical protein
LRSIALRHPSLKDVSLWKLIAQINNLSTDLDDNGNPVAALSRNNKIKLPTPQEIHEFKTHARKRVTPAQTPEAVPLSAPVSAEVDPDEVITPDVEYVPELDSLLRALRVPVPTEDADKQVSQLADSCRIARIGEVRGSSVPYVVSLEVKQKNSWVPVITYEITGEQSWRFERTPGGSRKGKQINLPVRLAKQMAENDIMKNWRQYAEAHNIVIS